jgi:hypothetical protein
MCYSMPMSDNVEKQTASEVSKAFCPLCDGERNCIIHGRIEKKWPYELLEIEGAILHSLMECMGCETVFYHSASWNSEDRLPDSDDYLLSVQTFPKPSNKARPQWLYKLFKTDAVLYRILMQMYFVLDSQAKILAAIALRTALDRSTQLLGIDSTETFEKKLDALLSGGWIGQTQRDILSVVTDAGNAAAHRGWEPSSDELKLLVRSLEDFLHQTFIVGKDALGIRDNIPPKPQRPKAAKAKPNKNLE